MDVLQELHPISYAIPCTSYKTSECCPAQKARECNCGLVKENEGDVSMKIVSDKSNTDN